MATLREQERDNALANVKQKLNNIELFEDILKLSGNLYLFQNIDNVMVIYNSKPNVDAVLSYDGWKSFNRHVLRGRSGICTFGGETALGSNAIFFYDLKDTGVLAGAKDEYINPFSYIHDFEDMGEKTKTLYSDRISGILKLQGESEIITNIASASAKFAIYNKLGFDSNEEHQVLMSIVRDVDTETLYHALQISQRVSSTILTNLSNEILRGIERKGAYENRSDSRVERGSIEGRSGVESVRGLAGESGVTTNNEARGSESNLQIRQDSGSVLSGGESVRNIDQRGDTELGRGTNQQIRNAVDTNDGRFTRTEPLSERFNESYSQREISVSEFHSASEVHSASSMGNVRTNEDSTNNGTSRVVEKRGDSGQHGIYQENESNNAADRRTNIYRDNFGEQELSGNDSIILANKEEKEGATLHSSFFNGIPVEYIESFINNTFHSNDYKENKWAGSYYVIRDIFDKYPSARERANQLSIQADNNYFISRMHSLPRVQNGYIGGTFYSKITLTYAEEGQLVVKELSLEEFCEFLDGYIKEGKFYPQYEVQKAFYEEVAAYKQTQEFKAISNQFDYIHEYFVFERSSDILVYDDAMFDVMAVFTHTHHLGVILNNDKDLQEFIKARFDERFNELTDVQKYAIEEYIDNKFLELRYRNGKKTDTYSNKGYNFEIYATSTRFASYQKFEVGGTKKDRALAEIIRKAADKISNKTFIEVPNEQEITHTTLIDDNEDNSFIDVSDKRFIEGDEFVIDDMLLEVFKIQDNQVVMIDRSTENETGDIEYYTYDYDVALDAYHEYIQDLQTNGATLEPIVSYDSDYEQLDMFAMLGIDNEPKNLKNTPKTNLPDSYFGISTDLGTYLNPYSHSVVPSEYITGVVSRGSGFVGGKYRIMNMYMDNTLSKQDRIRKIREEYGTGGASWPMKNDDGSDKYGLHGYMSDGKGIEVNWKLEDGEHKGTISWKDVEYHIGKLIAADIYYPKYKEHHAFEVAKKEFKESEQYQELKTCMELTFNYLRKKDDIDYIQDIQDKYSDIVRGASAYYVVYRAMNGNSDNWEIYNELRGNLHVYTEVYSKAQDEVLTDFAEYHLHHHFDRLHFDQNNSELLFMLSSLEKFRESTVKAETEEVAKQSEVIIDEQIEVIEADEVIEETSVDIPVVDKVYLSPFDKDNIANLIMDADFVSHHHARAFLYEVSSNKELPKDKRAYFIGKMLRSDADSKTINLYYKGLPLHIDANTDGLNLTYAESINYSLSYNELADKLVYRVGYVGLDKYVSKENIKGLNNIYEANPFGIYKEYHDVVLELQQLKEKLASPAIDYRFDGVKFTDSLVGAGLKTRFGWNIDAIKVLKQIEAENRNATPEEQEILAHYCGWGGLYKAFDSSDQSWSKEYAQLKEVLTFDEYTSAKSTVNDAFYTEPRVASALGRILESCGFKEGNLLEPSVATGHIIGNLPESIHANKFGVEIDSISGRIASLLYPSMNVTIDGYQNTQFSDGFFDCAIGNVPFGNYRPYDSKYNRHNFKIHDYFFAKTLDQVRPNGIIAFITSTGTLDKTNSTVRKYIGERAELLGAIRLPNTAFKSLAGTEVATDIIVLRRREAPIVTDESWYHLGYTEDNVPINEYFVEHPEMCLGKMVYETGRFGEEGNYTTCVPSDVDYIEALNALIPKVFNEEMYKTIDLDEENKENNKTIYIPARPEVSNHTFAIVEDKVYYRNDSIMEEVAVSATNKKRIIAFVELTTVARKIVDMQVKGCTDEELEVVQEELNKVYDVYVSSFGHVLDGANEKVLRNDDNYCFVCSLEELKEDGSIAKTDIFTKRTINPHKEIVTTETAFEALRVSLAETGRVDIPFMLGLYEPDLADVDTTEMTDEELYSAKRDVLIKELYHIIYLDPNEYNKNNLDIGWKTSDEYLSGNVREKEAKALSLVEDEFMGPTFADNAEMLHSVIPDDIPYTDIDVKLGSSWIEPEDYAEFMFQTFNIPQTQRNTYPWLRRGQDITKLVGVKLNDITMEYRVTGQPLCKYNSYCNSVYGTKEVNATAILEKTLNFKQITVYYPGSRSKDVNREATMLARDMQEKMKLEFKDWFWKDEARREKYVRKYNDMFNAVKLREYDGSFLTFKGMNANISLKEHQKNAIARILLGGNTLLAHCVGAGKSFEMIAAIMEQKRLGLANKPLLIVPKSIVGQMEAEFMRLYPSANVLAVKDKDFDKKNRQKFIARIATGEYDCVIMSHSQFEMIPLSQEREVFYKQQELDSLENYLLELKSSGDNWTIKRIEDALKKRTEEMAKLLDTPKDKTISFEQLGVDALFVDEAHNFKNMAIYSKISNVAGIPTASSKKAFDMRLKCRYINEISGGKGLVFATGTPVSNTMAEMYVMQSFLQPERLEELGINAFDAWLGSFGDIQATLELKVAGNGYKVKNRVKNFQNVPELMSVFKEVADIQTADMLNLPVPKLRTGAPIVIECEMDDTQLEILETLIERADALEKGGVDPSEDNMLKLTNEAKQLGTDARLLWEDAPSNPDGKLFKCAETIYDEYVNGNKDGKIGCQLVFSDMGTPKQDGSFDIYNTIKNHLIDMGIPKEEIAFIHDAKNDAQKDLLFKQTRNGQIKVLFGSTDKCGTGVNVQTHLTAMHHIDCPWKPSAIEQRNGRGVRQGNENEEIAIYHYITKGSFDAYSWSLVENKQKFISQIMTSKPVGRTCEDVDEAALNYGVFKAVATGDDTIREKMELENDLTKLRMLKSGFNKQRQENENKVNHSLPIAIAQARDKIGIYMQEIAFQKSAPVPVDENGEIVFSMKIQGEEYTSRKEAGIALNQAVARLRLNETLLVGEYHGYAISVSILPKNQNGEVGEKTLFLKRIDGGKASHETLIGLSTVGNIIKVLNLYNSFEKNLEKEKTLLQRLETDLEVCKAELKKEFPHEAEIKQKEQRLKEIDALVTSADVDVFDENFESGSEEKTLEEQAKEVLEEVVEAEEQTNDVLNDNFSSDFGNGR